MARAALWLVPLTLASCSGEKGETSQPRSPVPSGFELASATVPDMQAEPQVIDLTVADLRALRSQGSVRLIDVRRDDEVSQGMIEGAEHIPLDQFDPTALDLSDDREVVLYCRSGRRSTLAGQRLAQHTGKPAKHLAGGYLAWSNASE